MSSDTLRAVDASQEVLRFLKSRRSTLVKNMISPGPDASQIADILQTASRVPDHRKLAPFRFLTFTGKAREDFGKHIGAAFAKAHPDMPLDRTVFEAGRFLRAPVVIAVIASPVDCSRGTPKSEQIFTAGAVCFQMLLAARAMGFAGQWLTEWYAYDAAVQKALGLSGEEQVAGFIYLGSASEDPSERARPDVGALTQAWTG